MLSDSVSSYLQLLWRRHDEEEHAHLAALVACRRKRSAQVSVLLVVFFRLSLKMTRSFALLSTPKSLQLRILLRAMELLKPGGRLVYSTCSFNPIENEAVVSAALNKNSSFSIVDVSSSLPILNRRPGMLEWKAAFDKDTKICATYKEFLASGEVKEEIKEKITESLWPKGNEKELGIEKWCVLSPILLLAIPCTVLRLVFVAVEDSSLLSASLHY